jgi:tRNA threonylcarbamoyladenosine biosynthesis protein TsaB
VRLLAVDTTTPRGSLAVVGEAGVLAETRQTTADGHSRWLLPAVEAALRDLRIEAVELDGFAVTTGPGSFTGIRVGVSTVQGLALATGRPCVGRAALDVLGEAAAAAVSGPVVALMDAFRGEVYSAAYTEGILAGKRHVGPLADVLSGLSPGTAFVGDAVLARRAEIGSAVRDARFPEVDLFLAAALGRAALRDLAEGRVTSASALRPLYLRGVDIRAPRPS